MHKAHNETIPKCRFAEKPCAASIFAKRKRLIVSDTLVSKLSTLFLVGVGRLELPASWSRTKRATNCATPRNSFYIIISIAVLVKNNLFLLVCI